MIISFISYTDIFVSRPHVLKVSDKKYKRLLKIKLLIIISKDYCSLLLKNQMSPTIKLITKESIHIQCITRLYWWTYYLLILSYIMF